MNDVSKLITHKSRSGLIISTALGAVITLCVILYNTGETHQKHENGIKNLKGRQDRMEITINHRLDRMENKLDKIMEMVR